MSEYELDHSDTSEGHGSLAAAHEETGAEQDHQSQYGILEQDHQSYEHEEFENVKHIEYTDAAGNHYEVTEYTHYEHTEIEQEHTFLAEGSDSSAGFGEADGGVLGVGSGESDFSAVDSITSRFENFLGSSLHSDNEISDSSA